MNWFKKTKTKNLANSLLSAEVNYRGHFRKAELKWPKGRPTLWPTLASYKTMVLGVQNLKKYRYKDYSGTHYTASQRT